MSDIDRLITAMVTPVDASLNVDYGQARRLAKALVASGSDAAASSLSDDVSPSSRGLRTHHLHLGATNVAANGTASALVTPHGAVASVGNAASAHATATARRRPLEHPATPGFGGNITYRPTLRNNLGC